MAMSKMLPNISLSSLIIFYLVAFSSAGGGLSVKFRITSFKICISTEKLLNKYKDISLQQCVNECAFRKSCRAVNYFRYFQTCELLPVDSGDALHSGGKNSACVLVKKTDMDLSEVRFVFYIWLCASYKI